MLIYMYYCTQDGLFETKMYVYIVTPLTKSNNQ